MKTTTLALAFAWLAFIAAPQAAVADEDDTYLGSFGGPGGSAFEYRCSGNGYLVGVLVYAGAWIDNIQAVCGKYDPSGHLLQQAPEGPIFGGVRPSQNQSDSILNTKRCGPDDLIYSFDTALTEQRDYLGRIRMACFSAKTLQRPANTYPGAAIKLIQGTDPPRNDTNRFAVCPEGTAATGITGRYGDYLDAFGLMCGPTGVLPLPAESRTNDGLSSETILNPIIQAHGGTRLVLDWCRVWGKECGDAAAAQYCREHVNGLPYARHFASRSGAGRTAVIGTGQICSGPGCVAFAEITCATSLDKTTGSVLRPSGHLPFPPGSATPPPQGSLTTGTFDTTFGVLELRETEGNFSQKNGHVTVTKTQGNVVHGTWEQSTAAQRCPDGRFRGKFVFAFNPGGFTGSYGYCNGPTNAGEWNGTRR